MRKQFVKTTESLLENDKNITLLLGDIGIFGSFSKDRANSNSDIDIVIETSKVDLFMLVHLKEELEKLFNRNVDIIRYRERMNQFLKKHIDEEAIYV